MICKTCGIDNTCQSNVNGEDDNLEEGSITICFSCAAVEKYVNGDTVPLSVEDRMDIATNHPEEWDKILFVQQKIREFAKMRENANRGKAGS